MPLKPTLTEIHGFLQSNNALIVHFSGAPPGASFGINRGYPHDLHDVINGGAQTGLACSVVTPSDNFSDVGSRNAIGCIGVIVGLRTPQSLLAVDPSDAGSINNNGARLYRDKDITMKDLDDSLLLRTGYNEWGVKDYEIKGILAVSPFQIWDHTPPGGPDWIDIHAVLVEFHSVPVYVFAYNEIRLASAISAGDIYP
jgi:hypothetical protein